MLWEKILVAGIKLPGKSLQLYLKCLRRKQREFTLENYMRWLKKCHYYANDVVEVKGALEESELSYFITCEWIE